MCNLSELPFLPIVISSAIIYGRTAERRRLKQSASVGHTPATCLFVCLLAVVQREAVKCELDTSARSVHVSGQHVAGAAGVDACSDLSFALQHHMDVLFVLLSV